MALWGKNDQANNVPKFAGALVNKTPNTANATELYGNTTATGIVAIDASEIAAGGGVVAHTGWVLRTVGTGRRAGRVQTEVLVAGSIVGDNAGDGQDQYTISISIQPGSKSVNTGLATTFSVGAVTIPSGGSVTYQWQANTGAGFSNLSNAGVYSNVATSTLSISNVGGLNAVQYRVNLAASGASNVTSSAAVLTVV